MTYDFDNSNKKTSRVFETNARFKISFENLSCEQRRCRLRGCLVKTGIKP